MSHALRRQCTFTEHRAELGGGFSGAGLFMIATVAWASTATVVFLAWIAYALARPVHRVRRPPAEPAQ